jgi:hypothetical protein
VVTSLFVIFGVLSFVIPFIKSLHSGDAIDAMQYVSYACLVFIYAGALRLLRSSHDLMVAFSVLFDARHRVFLHSARIDFANRVRSRYIPLLKILSVIFMLAAGIDSVATSWRLNRVQARVDTVDFSVSVQVRVCVCLCRVSFQSLHFLKYFLDLFIVIRLLLDLRCVSLDLTSIQF